MPREAPVTTATFEVTSVGSGIVQRTRVAPHVSPAPNEVNRTRSPWRIRPARQARSSAIGIEAAIVLPTSATSTTAFAGSMPSRSTTAIMMRAFAWWGISTSTSSIE